jgi:hypothetical protein
MLGSYQTTPEAERASRVGMRKFNAAVQTGAAQDKALQFISKLLVPSSSQANLSGAALQSQSTRIRR